MKRGAIFIFTIIGIGMFAAALLLSRKEDVPPPAPSTLAAFSQSINDTEKQQLIEWIDAIDTADVVIDFSTITFDVNVVSERSDNNHLLQTFLPVVAFADPRQSTTQTALASTPLMTSSDEATTSIMEFTKQDASVIEALSTAADIGNEAIGFVTPDELAPEYKLLSLDGAYYLESLNSGAVFRELTITSSIDQPEALALLSSPPIAQTNIENNDILSLRMTGVTALTRVMMRKLDEVGDPLYFSEKIGDYLAAADLTHTSNEVSFQDPCGYSNALFCSPPTFMQTLEDSGFDIIELTGNHNNDVGRERNTATIAAYNEKGWATFGGGTNLEDAAKPHQINQKGASIAMLGYNFADSPSGLAIATTTEAGANPYDKAQMTAEVQTAKAAGQYVIVTVQFWECYAYPEPSREYPECDVPIGEQQPVFRDIIDAGADMVVGTAAHQPQTYELYNGKPIYYGLGNLYFEQTRWPGTTRSLILTHYFVDGKYKQTQITPTVFDTDLQTRLTTDEEADFILTRLQQAQTALN